MGKLTFTLGFKDRDILLSLHEEGSPKTKKIYRQDLPIDPLIDFLAEIKTAYAKSFGLGASIDQIDLNQIIIPLKKAHAFFEKVTKEQILFFQKERLSVDFQKKASFYFLVLDSLETEGRIFWDGVDFPLKECKVFASTMTLFFWKNRVGCLETEVSWKWLSKLQEGNQFIKNLQDLEAECDPLDPLSPRIKKKAGKKIEVLPLLKLTDATFSFAELLFCYGEKKISFHDSSSFPMRQKEEEARFEKDLLETGFQRKGLNYFCPLDKSGDALQLLLEIGWKVEDREERSLLPLSSHAVTVKEENGEVQIEGELVFQDSRCSLSQVFPGIKDRPSLFDLGGKKAAFLHPKLLENILKVREKPKSLRFPKSALASLQTLLKDDRVIWEEKIKKVAEGFSGKLEDLVFHQPFQADLYPYQKEGVKWLNFLYGQGLGGLLADEMGLGKTIQILAFFACIRTNLPILVVTPSSLIYNWKAEIERFIPNLMPHLYLGPKRTLALDRKIILTTYPILRQDEEILGKCEFACVVLDESSAIKNDASLTAKAAYKLKAGAKFALNGTPIENSLDELWSQFHFVQPSLLGEKKSFLKNPGNIKESIRPFFLKRTKNQVDLQLPPKFEQVVWVEMEEEESRLYEKYLSDAVKILEEGEDRPLLILEKILRLRQILCHPKLLGEELSSSKFQLFMDDIETMYEQRSKVLIYSQFTEMLKLMRDRFQEKGYSYLYMDGDTPPQDRQNQVTLFQKDPEKQLFLISLKAGGVGLTLTAADYVVLYDPWWNEAVEEQATARAHRIGRDKSLIIKKYLTLQSLEENMLSLKKHKAQLALTLEDINLSLKREDWLHLLK